MSLMSFALCGPDGALFIFGLVFLLMMGVCLAGIVVAAVYATIGLGKLAARRHLKRLAAGAG